MHPRSRPEMELEMELSVEELRYWRATVGAAVERVGTPCFVFSASRLANQVARLEAVFGGMPVRHWWSYKTLPLEAAVEWWRGRGRPVEVVSAMELESVLKCGYEPEQVLVNGPAKHTWLPGFPVSGLRVNFDSVAEIRAMGSLAKRRGWKVGVRLGMTAETNFEYPTVRAPFGLVGGEVGQAARLLRRQGLGVEVVHFHLRTNVPEPRYYREAIMEAMGLAAAQGWRPGVLDIGGGFPPDRVRSRKGAPLNAGFGLEPMREIVRLALVRHGLKEVWMENGRWLVAPAGVLAVRVLDVKEDVVRGARTLVCDGGRTLHAMVATWEQHRIVPLAERRAAAVETMVHGPTCMTFDNLGVHRLSAGVREGDVLIWLDAGAYQLGWETRFSHGWAGVVWAEADEIRPVREKVHCQPGANP